MIRIFRVAGSAAAALMFAMTATFAGPSLAEDFEATPHLAAYTDHADVSLAAADSALGTLDTMDRAATDQGTLPQNAVLSTPVAQHAIAAPEPEAPAAEAPERARGRSLAELVRAYSSAETENAEQACLAGAIYYESNGEPLQGQLTVAEVIINRARSGRFPSTICGVITQRGQFSFVRGGRIPTAPRSSAGWRTAVAIAKIAQLDLAEGGAPRAMFFHARRVSPGWRGLTRVATVGNHVFYR